MIPCKECQGTQFELKTIVSISELEVRQDITSPLATYGRPELHYYCINCGWECLGIFGPDD